MGTAPLANASRADLRPSWVWIAAIVVWLASFVPHLNVEIWGQHANRQLSLIAFGAWSESLHGLGGSRRGVGARGAQYLCASGSSPAPTQSTPT